MTNLPTSIKAERLFLTFLSPLSFYSNPVRSFLQYLQDSKPFRFVNFPPSLYTASETLVDDYQTLKPSLQLSEGKQYLAEMSIIPEENDATMLVLDFGAADIASQVISELFDHKNIPWLVDIISTGVRMTFADCAFIGLETQPNETFLIEVEDGVLYLEKLPIMLWTTAFLSEEVSLMTNSTHQTKQQPDGATLIIPKHSKFTSSDKPLA